MIFLQLSAKFVQQIISKQAVQEKGSVIDILPKSIVARTLCVLMD